MLLSYLYHSIEHFLENSSGSFLSEWDPINCTLLLARNPALVSTTYLNLSVVTKI